MRTIIIVAIGLCGLAMLADRAHPQDITKEEVAAFCRKHDCRQYLETPTLEQLEKFK